MWCVFLIEYLKKCILVSYEVDKVAKYAIILSWDSRDSNNDIYLLK